MATLTPTDWVMAAARTLSAEGVDHIRVEALARDLKVSKGSFYWHFANRDSLLEALLHTWESLGTEVIIADVDAQSANPLDRVHALIDRTFGQPEHDGIELGIRAWAQRDPAARATVERVDARRIGYVNGLLVACGVDAATARTRTEFMYRTLIGEFVLRSHGSPPLPEQTLRDLGASLVAVRTPHVTKPA